MSKIRKISYDVSDTYKKTIVVLSDIHYYHMKDKKILDVLYDQLITLKYDYICIPGDFIDCSMISDSDIFVSFIESLARTSKIIFSFGNHDVRHKKNGYYYNANLLEKLKRIRNVKVLDNEIYKDGKINFIGLTLPIDYYNKYKENNNYFIRYVNNEFRKSVNGQFNILLCHSPLSITNEYVFDNVKLLNNIKLVISGHTHGGITPYCCMKFLKGRGFITPSRKMFIKNLYGLKKYKDTSFVISSGIKKASHSNPFRMLDNCFFREITIIHI